MHLTVNARFESDVVLHERDPNVFPGADTSTVREVMMGDIVRVPAGDATIEVEVIAHAPIERVEIRNGTDVVETARPYHEGDLGPRIRVIWSGAEYRGRGRQTTWIGRARFAGCTVRRLEKINAWNHERLLAQRGADTVEWNAMTTGNFGGFDVWLDESLDADLDLSSNHGAINCPLANIALEDVVLDAGGLERKIRVFRLPDTNSHREFRFRVPIELAGDRDNPLWVCVTTEDGFQAWSSPIFAFR